jgi:anthranilate 1,2-dioxygenase small subunit
MGIVKTDTRPVTASEMGNTDDPLARHALRLDIDAFHAEYCHVLDEGDLQLWPEFFVDDCFYSVTARENFDAGLPVGLIYCEGKGMLKDRAFAIMNTAMFAPRYLRHFVTNTRIIGILADGAIEAQANYILLETLHDNPKGSIHQAGAYRDVFERQPDGRLLLRRRVCVYDNLLVPNALVLPV